MHIYNKVYGGNWGGGVCLREIHVIQCMYKTAKDHFIDKYLD